MGRAKKDNSHLQIEDITSGYPGLTSIAGANMMEACIVTLYNSKHKTGVKLLITGNKREEISLYWNKKCDDQMKRTWNDQDEATELAATCLSIILAFRRTGYSVIERSFKKTGIDYWLGENNSESLNIFNHKARLEISGIFKGDEKKIESRIKVKKKQSRQSDDSKLPAFISVVEFSLPQSKFVRRK